MAQFCTIRAEWDNYERNQFILPQTFLLLFVCCFIATLCLSLIFFKASMALSADFVYGCVNELYFLTFRTQGLESCENDFLLLLLSSSSSSSS